MDNMVHIAFKYLKLVMDRYEVVQGRISMQLRCFDGVFCLHDKFHQEMKSLKVLQFIVVSSCILGSMVFEKSGIVK